MDALVNELMKELNSDLIATLSLRFRYSEESRLKNL